jgi:hypothetical protein
MRRWAHILIALGICLLAFGCAPARHVMIMPLNDDFDIEALEIDEPGLEGKWFFDRNDEVWEFESDKDGYITLKINGTREIDVLLVNYNVGQVLLTYDEGLASDLRGLSMPLAGLFLIRRDAEEIILMEIDPEWLDRLNTEDPEGGWSRKFDDRIFLISTGSVDRLLRDHGDDQGAFRRYGVLRPLKGSQR